MIPITCSVEDRSTGRKRVFHAKVVNHPLLAPLLIPIAVDEAIYEVHPVPGDATATVRTEITTDVMVGSPGETEADHADTIALLEATQVPHSHTFRWSARPGTPFRLL